MNGAILHTSHCTFVNEPTDIEWTAECENEKQKKQKPKTKNQSN